METTHSEKRRGGVLVVSNRIPLPRREQRRATRHQRTVPHTHCTCVRACASAGGAVERRVASSEPY